MKNLNIIDFIRDINIEIPDESEFLNLSKQLPIDPAYPQHYILNYERGMLLYALIAKYKPKTV